MENSLCSFFKNKRELDTEIGKFIFVRQLGQGGNAQVFEFSKKELSYAVKFISEKVGEKKINRFIDEYLVTVSLDERKYIVKPIHIGSINIDNNNYKYIIMKKYSKTLLDLRESLSDEDIWGLFIDLLKGLKIIHFKRIIHRDIKPQNIFLDEENECFVLADFGIAHINDDFIAKNAHTSNKERLSNYHFSAPEQSDNRAPIAEYSDIYALGQLIYWCFMNRTIRGTNRESILDKNDISEKNKILDKFIEKAVRDNPLERFQNIEEIQSFITGRDLYEKIFDFDEVICQSFPQIDKIKFVNDFNEIDRFLNNFREKCIVTEFDYMLMNGGDYKISNIKKENGRWIINEFEITVDQVFIYHDSAHPYKSFFIITTKGEEEFKYYSSSEDTYYKLGYLGQWISALLFEQKFYINPDELKNNYYEYNNEVIKVDNKRFVHRVRMLSPNGLMVYPSGTASSSMLDRTPTQKMIESIVLDIDTKKIGKTLIMYLSKTADKHGDYLLRS